MSRSRRRAFGAIRRLPSGRYQARYTDPDGTPRLAPTTFDTEDAAERWLVAQRGREAQSVRDAAAELITALQSFVRAVDAEPTP